jgi:formamidopyrimidine-DNA glycosylase
MPELPDITVYVEALAARISGETLERIQLTSPFLLRSVDPPIEEAEGRTVCGVSRLGKRVVIDLAGDLHLVLHLMIAGRLQWKRCGAKPHRRMGLAAFEFSSGTLLLTEASKKRRASLHLVRGADGLTPFDRGGLEVFAADLQEFARTLRRENHTLKRALTDPRLFSGIGNAYSDEILHRARLSPLRLTGKLCDEEVERLFAATVSTLEEWIARLREEAGADFPKKVTAFHPQMAVHGRHREPCPVCGAPVQRIVYAENETNYCPGCQTDGRILADRALSRLLKKDWPRSLDEL